METSCKNLVQEKQDLVRDLLYEDGDGAVTSPASSSALHILKLPDSIILQIFFYLPFSSIGAVAQVCTRWNQISYDELLWRHVFLHHYKLPSKTTMPPKAKSWRLEFKRLYYHTPAVLSEERKEHRDEVLHVSFSHDGTMFATCSKDGFFKIWECTHPVRLLFKMDMKSSFSWKFTQFSQFNETDTCLLVSGVYFGRLSTSGEIAVFNLQDDFRMQCRVTNKPYDVFGAWYDNDHLLSGTLYWTGDFNSVSAVWLSKASQEVESEVESVSMVLYRFENVNSSSIRLLHVAEVDKDVDVTGSSQDRDDYSESAHTSPQSSILGPEDDGKGNYESDTVKHKQPEVRDKCEGQEEVSEEGTCILDQLLRKYIAEDEFDVENEDKTDEEDERGEIPGEGIATADAGLGLKNPFSPSFEEAKKVRSEEEMEVDGNVQSHVWEQPQTLEEKFCSDQPVEVQAEKMPELSMCVEKMVPQEADVPAAHCDVSAVACSNAAQLFDGAGESIQVDQINSLCSNSLTAEGGEDSTQTASILSLSEDHCRMSFESSNVIENSALRTNMPPIAVDMQNSKSNVSTAIDVSCSDSNLSDNNLAPVSLDASLNHSSLNHLQIHQSLPAIDSQAGSFLTACSTCSGLARPSSLPILAANNSIIDSGFGSRNIAPGVHEYAGETSKSSPVANVAGCFKDGTDANASRNSAEALHEHVGSTTVDVCDSSSTEVSKRECCSSDTFAGAYHIAEAPLCDMGSHLPGASNTHDPDSASPSVRIGAEHEIDLQQFECNIDRLEALSNNYVPFMYDDASLMLIPGASNIYGNHSCHHVGPSISNGSYSATSSSNLNNSNNNNSGSSTGAIHNGNSVSSCVDTGSTDNCNCNSCPEHDIVNLDILTREPCSSHSLKSSTATQTDIATSRTSSFHSLSHMSHSSSMSRDLRCSPPREKLLIYTWGSETYIPHKVGIKRMKWTDFNKGEIKARRSSMLLPDVMENLHNMAGNRRDKPDVTIEMHGHIVGLSLSPDHKFLYVNCRPWPKNYIISDPQESPPLAQEVEISTIDLTTFNFVGPVLRSHKAYTHSDECFFLNLDVSDDYVASGAEDRQGYLWDRHYGIPLYRFPHRNVVNCVASNPQDPEMLVTVSDDHTFKVWMSRCRANECTRVKQEVKDTSV